MIGSAVVSQVSRKVATPGGTVSAISRMRDSGMGPGPLGIRDTRPRADAPIRTASAASSSDAMQQTLTLGGTGNITEPSVDTIYGNCIQSYRRAARVQRLLPATRYARGNMLTRKSRLLLGLAAATPLLFAACTDNSILNPMSDAAGTYQLTVYAGKSMPATYLVQTGYPNCPPLPNGGTLVVTSGDLILNNNGTFIETNNYSCTATGGATTPSNWVSSGTWTLNGTIFSLSDPARSRQVTGTLEVNISNALTINFMEDDGTGIMQSYEYIR